VGEPVVRAAGLAAGERYRCASCGNLTRFDVESVERVRRFWHVDLSGDGRVEEEERPEVDVVRVTCRWCGSSEQIEVVAVPGAARTDAGR
jgi:RNase P subunit RPR2